MEIKSLTQTTEVRKTELQTESKSYTFLYLNMNMGINSLNGPVDQDPTHKRL